MELQKQFATFPFIFTFLFFLLILVKLIKKSNTENPLLLPPGPSKLPFIGHLHHLLGQPHHSLRDLAKIYGPLMYLKLGEISTIVVSSPSVAKKIMKTHDQMFLDRPFNLVSKIASYGGKDVGMAPYGDYWRQVKKICILELLSAKRVQSFWAIREEEVMNLVGKISSKAGSPVDLSEKISTLTNDIICRAAFGQTLKDKNVFIAVMKEVIRLASGFSIHDLFPSLKFLEVISGIKPKMEKMHQQFDKLLDDIIEEHKKNRTANKKSKDGDVKQDLVDVLLRLQEGTGLELPITVENVKAIIFDVFSAGTDTSSTLTEWVFSELLKNPRVMEKTQAEVRQVFNGKIKIDQGAVNELNYLKLVVKETLRLHPPGPLIPRECKETCEIEGYEIPKGSKVLINAWAIGRDPAHWKNPESFEPERFEDLSIDYKGNNFELIPFGAGRRMCPGILFGIANVELPIALLLYHFDWKLPNGVKLEELDMTEAFSAAVGRKNHLYAIPTPYNPYKSSVTSK